MNIAFYNDHSYWGQMNNNGGTKTIIRSVETLERLGHRADIVCSKDKFTWFKHKAPIRKIPKDTDSVIAVSIHDVRPALKVAPSGARVYLWLREWPLWKMKVRNIKNTCKKVRVLVNSEWLYIKLRSLHVFDCFVVRSGIDIDFWKDMGGYRDMKAIGGLYHEFHKTKKYSTIKKVKKSFPDRKYVILNKDYKNLNDTQLRLMYNGVGIWLAPTKLEGFHNVPAEANLCGCLVYCNRLSSNGMGDYANEETAMRYDSRDELYEKLRNPDYSKVEKMQQKIKKTVGDREHNMKKMVKVLNGTYIKSKILRQERENQAQA